MSAARDEIDLGAFLSRRAVIYVDLTALDPHSAATLRNFGGSRVGALEQQLKAAITPMVESMKFDLHAAECNALPAVKV